MMLQPYRLSPKNIINIKKGIKIKFLQEQFKKYKNFWVLM
jgi:hypothetical protein